MHIHRKCWFDPFEEQFISPFLSDCPSLPVMLGIAIHCIQHSQAMMERGVCELAHSFFHLLCVDVFFAHFFEKSDSAVSIFTVWSFNVVLVFVCSPLVQFQLLHSKYHLCGPATRGLILSTYIKFVNLFPEIKSTIQDVCLYLYSLWKMSKINMKLDHTSGI